MVDLPACKTVMRTQKIKRQWLDREEFYLARRRAGLTPSQAADMLQVTTRTLRNWENGSSRIPYATFRLMRLHGGHQLVDKAWNGWSIHRGVLYSPAGRGFEPYQLTYLGNYLWMARQWLKERATANANNVKNQTLLATRVAKPLKPSIAELETSVHDEARDATASSGSRLHQIVQSLSATVASLQSKNLNAQQFGNMSEFRTIAEAANDMIHSEVN